MEFVRLDAVPCDVDKTAQCGDSLCYHVNRWRGLHDARTARHGHANKNYVCSWNHRDALASLYKEEIIIMAQPIRLGLVIDDPEDVRVFNENMKNPKVTKEQVEFFKRAIEVYESHKF